jgi:hypothetical protein
VDDKLWFLKLVEELQRKHDRQSPAEGARPTQPRPPRPTSAPAGGRRRGAREARRAGR